MATAEIPFQTLQARRHQLGMSCGTLAQRTGLSEQTVRRILSGHSEASFANVGALADALGMGLKFDTNISVDDLREQQAKLKARRLVAIAQGTSALEGQAVDEETVGQMVKQTTYELLAGSPRKLWSL
jgi:transcriptional regulator with XRE-family HTH domain